MTKYAGVLRSAVDAPYEDDRVLPITRWVARFIIPWLAAAFLVLYGVPHRTTDLFAWTIRPEMTPMMMGAGYGAGVYFFYRVSTIDDWHKVSPVFLGITTFTWLMAIASVIHWGNFNHSHYTFYLWVFLYALTPVLIPGIWVLNRRTGYGGRTGDVVHLPRAIRLLSAAIGVLATAGAVAIFAAPELMIGSWPWAVSPFTARILAGWFALFGVVNAVVVMDPRWSGARLLVESEILGFGLVLVGVARFWENFDTSNPLTWAVVGGMVLYVGAILVLYFVMESR